MINMNQKQEVLLRYFRQGHSKKRIARELRLNIKTVRKYLAEYSKQRAALEEAEGKEVERLIEALTQGPQYDSSGRRRTRLTEEVQQKIDGYVSENRRKRSCGWHKQVMKKVDVYEALRKEGYPISYPTVCSYMRLGEQPRREAYIRQSYEPGQVCEFDWAEVKLHIGGQERTCQLATFTAAMSNYRWACLFDRQDTASFQQAHAEFFAHLGGVYCEMVYDNMRVAVGRFVGRYEKEPTEGLLRLSMYYQFGFRFCNVRRGNEKGHAERSVEYIRRKAFAVRDEFDSRAEANAHLWETCRDLNGREQTEKGESAQALLEQERPYLHPCPPAAFECGQWRPLRVDKYATVNLGNNNYSVPESLVGKMVDVKVCPAQLVAYYQTEEVCRHERRYTQHGWYIQLGHYLSTLERKPGALAGSVALQQAGERLRCLYGQHFKEHPKTFIELLQYQREKQVPLDKLEGAIQSLCLLSPQDISLDKVRVLCERQEALPKQACSGGAIEQHAVEQLRALAEMLPQADSLTVQTQVL